MTEEELIEYYAGLELLVGYFDTKIDFEDIENPLKTAWKNSKIGVNVLDPIGETLTIKQH